MFYENSVHPTQTLAVMKKPGARTRLTSLVSHLSVATVLHRIRPSFLRTGVSYRLPDLSGVSGRKVVLVLTAPPKLPIKF